MSSQPEVPAYVCSHVFRATRPVLFVSREDGDWQFLCGGSHASDETPRVVGQNHLIERDPSLSDLMDLPVEWEAERDTTESPWTRRRLN